MIIVMGNNAIKFIMSNLKTKINTVYLKIQFPPHRKNNCVPLYKPIG